MAIFKISVWRCDGCPYSQDFEPTPQAMIAQGFGSSVTATVEGVVTIVCPSCMQGQLNQVDALNSPTKMTVLEPDEVPNLKVEVPDPNDSDKKIERALTEQEIESKKSHQEAVLSVLRNSKQAIEVIEAKTDDMADPK